MSTQHALELFSQMAIADLQQLLNTGADFLKQNEGFRRQLQAFGLKLSGSDQALSGKPQTVVMKENAKISDQINKQKLLTQKEDPAEKIKLLANIFRTHKDLIAQPSLNYFNNHFAKTINARMVSAKRQLLAAVTKHIECYDMIITKEVFAGNSLYGDLLDINNNPPRIIAYSEGNNGELIIHDSKKGQQYPSLVQRIAAKCMDQEIDRTIQNIVEQNKPISLAVAKYNVAQELKTKLTTTNNAGVNSLHVFNEHFKANLPLLKANRKLESFKENQDDWGFIRAVKSVLSTFAEIGLFFAHRVNKTGTQKLNQQIEHIHDTSLAS